MSARNDGVSKSRDWSLATGMGRLPVVEMEHDEVKALMLLNPGTESLQSRTSRASLDGTLSKGCLWRGAAPRESERLMSQTSPRVAVASIATPN